MKVPLTWTAAVALVVAAVVAVALLVSDHRETFEPSSYGPGRSAVDRVLTPVGDVLSAPGRWIGTGVTTIRGYFFAVGENRRLKAELKEMRQWRDVAIALRDTNQRYQTLLGLKTDPPIPMVAARVVTDSRGPFSNSRLANAGSEKAVKTGNPVMSENGLVGRVVGVTHGASRVLLLTDIASRVPVMIDRTNARAILAGDGGPNPRLDYLRGRNPVREGDRVLTSGDGGVIPRGLPVGAAVKGLDGRWRVVLAADRAAIDFVRILLFEDFTQLVNRQELAKTEVPPPTAGVSAASVTAVAAPPAKPAPAAGPAPAPASATPAAKSAPDAAAKPKTAAAESKAASALQPAKAPAAKAPPAKAQPPAAEKAAAKPPAQEQAKPVAETAAKPATATKLPVKPKPKPAPKPAAPAAKAEEPPH